MRDYLEFSETPTPQEFWWNEITGANQLIKDTVSVLKDGKNVILNLPLDLSWRRKMRSNVIKELKDLLAKENVFDELLDITDSQENGSYGNDIGEFLLNHFCNAPEIRDGYRSISGKSIQDYLVDEKVLENKIVWVKGMTAAHEQAWTKFCRDYKNKSIDDGLFVIEVHNTFPIVDNRHVATLNFSDYINVFDVQLFCSFLISGNKQYSEEWKRYIVTYITSLCREDAEIAAEVIARIKDFRQSDIISILKEIAQDEDFKKRGSSDGAGHILTLVRDGKDIDINKRQWAAQVKSLFPLIEMERGEIVNCYHNVLQDILDNEVIEQYNERIDNTSDIELGTLEFMCRKYESDTNMPEDILDRIAFLRRCRNNIAHGDCCSVEDVRKLFDNKLKYD